MWRRGHAPAAAVAVAVAAVLAVAVGSGWVMFSGSSTTSEPPLHGPTFVLAGHLLHTTIGRRG